jgi:hypothetical protein
MGSKGSTWSDDNQFGSDRRDDSVRFLNSILAEHNVGGQFRRASSTEGRGKKFNDFVFESTDKKTKILFMFVYTSTGYYIKAAYKLKDRAAAMHYLNILKKKNYYTILIGDSGIDFSDPITIDFIQTWCDPKPYPRTKDNENRIGFSMSMKHIRLVHPEYVEKSGLLKEPPLWKKLEQLLHENSNGDMVV